MPTGPQKIILIRSGLYEYAEVEITGALQIVGPNNTGKTTLINTLQFLYLDDRRHMDFGSYTPDQTRQFYFPNQYSYVLFECLGLQGQCVIGWRGQSKASGAEPERFCHLGPFTESDFLDERRQVREPRDVNARLAPKHFRVLKSAQEHRELLLAPSATLFRKRRSTGDTKTSQLERQRALHHHQQKRHSSRGNVRSLFERAAQCEASINIYGKSATIIYTNAPWPFQRV